MSRTKIIVISLLTSLVACFSMGGATFFAVGNPVSLDATSGSAVAVTTNSITSNWKTVIDAGGPATRDAAVITNPTTEITDSTRHLFNRGQWKGTYLTVRMGYTTNVSGVTSPVICVFGRTGTDVWQRLRSKTGNRTAVLNVDITYDERDSSLTYTQVTDDQMFDCRGCNEFLIGFETAFAASTTNTSIIQVKPY